MSQRSQAIVINPAAGNEPALLGGHTAIAVNERLRAAGQEPLSIIIPVTSDRQRGVLKDEFSAVSGAEKIVLDDTTGTILGKVLRSQGSFVDHLGVLGGDEYLTAQAALNQRLGRSATALIELHGLLDGAPVLLDPRAIVGSLDTGGRVVLDTPRRDFAFPVLTSALVRAAREGGHDFSESDMRAVEGRMQTAEKGYDSRFIPLVHTLAQPSPDPTIPMGDKFTELADQPTSTPSGEVTYTPPMKDVKSAANFEGVDQPGIYAMMSGTDNGAAATYGAAKAAGLAVYTNPWAPPAEGVTNISPRALSDPRIEAIFGRAGWGTGWQALNLGKPWFVIPYQEGDDPEIAFNNSVIERLGVGVVVRPETFARQSLADHIARIAPRVRELRDLTTRKFGTSNGIDYMANKIAAGYLQSGLVGPNA